MVPYMFLGSPSIYAFDERKDPGAPAWPDHPPYEAFGIGDDPRFEEDPIYRDLALTKIAAYARGYDDVLLFGTKKEWTDALVARGLVVEFSHGSFAILRAPAGT
jgi:hypothetical protein